MDYNLQIKDRLKYSWHIEGYGIYPSKADPRILTDPTLRLLNLTQNAV